MKLTFIIIIVAKVSMHTARSSYTHMDTNHNYAKLIMHSMGQSRTKNFGAII